MDLTSFKKHKNGVYISLNDYCIGLGTEIYEPECSLTLSGDEAARTWCIDRTCNYERVHG